MKRLSQAAISVVAPLILLLGCGGGSSNPTTTPTTIEPTAIPEPQILAHVGLPPIDSQIADSQQLAPADEAKNWPPQ